MTVFLTFRDGLLAGERFYYDLRSLLRQLDAAECATRVRLPPELAMRVGGPPVGLLLAYAEPAILLVNDDSQSTGQHRQLLIDTSPHPTGLALMQLEEL